MRRRYGSSPLHLLGHVLLFALAGYAVVQIFALDDTAEILLWLTAAVLLHDAVLWPLYSGADGLGRRVLGRVNPYVRVPLALSLMLGLVFFATVSEKGESTYTRASGASWDGYAARWLAVSAVLFALSLAAYRIRGRRRPAVAR